MSATIKQNASDMTTSQATPAPALEDHWIYVAPSDDAPFSHVHFDRRARAWRGHSDEMPVTEPTVAA